MDFKSTPKAPYGSLRSAATPEVRRAAGPELLRGLFGTLSGSATQI